ncbi:MAG: 1-deoxy-D-xylulose-5-phosphate reductoisomerase [Oscillospiraceae bacterium]|nr:1-deoxy-D-xylulose-5-phosphate reductoisomerase [Oscillospiraceae bacterium]
MTKQIILLGSTGSIGIQTLQVAKAHNIKVVALSAHSNEQLLNSQAHEFGVKPEHTCLSSENPDKLCTLAAIKNCTVVNAIVGSAGLKPTLSAINAGNTVALANKETLVAGGEIVIKAAKDNNVSIIPIDSEHSAIMQCLAASNNEIHKIILTASGGAFLGYTKEQLKSVTKEQALHHPNWSMGAKITVDSATMMNKGLELIEAMHLFNVSHEQIEIVIHPQSIIHSAVEFTDGSIIAQMSNPDMRLPIQYALTYPKRLPCPIKRLSLTEIGQLTFMKPDDEVFPLLNLTREAAQFGGNAPCILNAANEAAVALFLNGKIAFHEISEIIEKTYNKTNKTKEISLEIIEQTEKEVMNCLSYLP